jgi:hypothetical protein
MKIVTSTSCLILAAALTTFGGCKSEPLTQEQKEQQALSKAYEAITSSRPDPGAKK